MRYDKKLIGFTICIFVISYLLLFGIETRYFIFYTGNFVGLILPLLLVVGFLLSAVFVGRYLQNKIATNPTVSISGKAMMVKYRPADKTIQTYISYRAKFLKISGEVKALSLPSTFNTVDAYVFGSGKNHCIVLTGGTQALFLLKGEENLAKFYFLVDHELGHIKGQDTGVLYFVKGILRSILYFLPLKFLLYYLIAIRYKHPFEFIGSYFTKFFPSIQRNDLNSFLPSEITPVLSSDTLPFAYIITFLVVFSLSLGIALLFFYMEILRRREFVADKFAKEHSASKEVILTVMSALFDYRPLANQPTQAFKSQTAYHPKPTERIKNITESEQNELPSAIAIICMIGVCLFFRFCYGNTSQSSDQNINMINLAILSGAFCLLLAIIFDNLINDDLKKGLSGLRTGLLAHLSFWSFLITVIYTIIYQTIDIAKTSHWATDLPYTEAGLSSLKKIANLDKGSLTFALPVTILAYGLIFSVIPLVWKNYSKNLISYFAYLLTGASAAIIFLAILSYGWNSLLTENQTALLAQFRSEQINSVHVKKNSISGIAQSSEDIASDSVLTVNHISIITSRYNRKKTEFFPPLCFVALWEHPINPSTF